MPSKNTSILTARIKDRELEILKETADLGGLTIPKLLGVIAEGFRSGELEIVGGVVKGVTPDEIDISELKRVAERHKMTPQRLLDGILEGINR